MEIMRDAGWPGDGEGNSWDRDGAEAAMERLYNDGDDVEDLPGVSNEP